MLLFCYDLFDQGYDQKNEKKTACMMTSNRD